MDTIKSVQTVIDGVNLNARHFAAMKKEDAVKAMELDGILTTHAKDVAWATKAHETMISDVKKFDTAAAAAATAAAAKATAAAAPHVMTTENTVVVK